MVSRLVHLAPWFNTMAIWIRVGIQFVQPGDRSLYSYCKAFQTGNVRNCTSSDSNDIPFLGDPLWICDNYINFSCFV